MHEVEAEPDQQLLNASQEQGDQPTLEELQAQFDATFDQTAVGLAHIALDGQFLRVNQKLCEILGYTHYELLTKRIQEVTHLYTVEIDAELLQQLLKLEIRTYSIEKQYVKRTGSIIWGKLTVSLVLHENKQPHYFVAVIEDISERKRTEASLLRYSQRVLGLHAIEQAILAKRSPQEIAQTSLCHLRQLIPCQQAMVLLFDFQIDEARVISSAADGELLFPEDTVFPLDRIFNSDELHINRFRHISDLTHLAMPCLLSQRLISGGMRSSLAIPLFVQATTIGELLVVDARTMAFNSDHVSIACEIADHLAIAIQNTRLFEQVRSDRERLQNLSARLLEAQETERRYIAHELHDEIGQALTAIKINLQILQHSLNEGDQSPRIDDSIAIVDNALQQVRHLSLDLRPSLLDDLGLQAALRWYIDRQIERTGICIDFQCLVELSLSQTIGTTCFRIVQEALTNVVRHAQATSVTIILQQQERSLHLLIQDDGVGFDPQTMREQTTRGHSLGLLGMEERALLVDGKITITSVPDQGTEIHLRLPL
ncbi:PAS domain S-box protein [Pantanalinema rosaneae CENA516]|uniref:GAF domain-containing sensor histidine kinase n=1 Tax=Pantanalinema rosaneae TaxID=1620701 RepID=UPI003D6E337A